MSRNILKVIKPTLESGAYKGSSGRIGLIGGCNEYTGAPYFGATAALRMGADLSHIFCSRSAGTAIKSYSPEVITHPVLWSIEDIEDIYRHKDEESEVIARSSESEIKYGKKAYQSIEVWLPKLHALIIGSGLGRDPVMFYTVRSVISKAKELKLPIILDADALYLISKEPQLIQGYSRAVLTPNANEFKRLSETSGGLKTVSEICKWFGGVTILQKGSIDLISDGVNEFEGCSGGISKRFGGQGDILAGIIGTTSAWWSIRAKKFINDNDNHNISLAASVSMGADFMKTLGKNATIFKLPISKIEDYLNSVLYDNTHINF